MRRWPGDGDKAVEGWYFFPFMFFLGGGVFYIFFFSFEKVDKGFEKTDGVFLNLCFYCL